MKFGSLFTGIGGFDLAFEQAGMTCAWQCEINAAARSVLAKHWPDVPCYEDVRNVTRDNTPTVDLICGGFPCQDLSVAGKRAGLAGERSGLWFEFARIIDELEPGWVVIENVPGLLSSGRGGDFAAIIRWMAERGYGVAWRVLDSQYFGVAQRRRRVFIVGSFGSGRAAEVLFEREGLPWNPPARREAREGYSSVAGTLAASRGGTERPAGNGNELDFCVPIAGTVSSKWAKGSGGPAGDEVQNLVAWHENKQGNLTPSDHAKALRASASHSYQGVGVRRLTPTECERLQGFPDDWTDGQTDSARYRQLGNAVTVNVIEWIGKRITEVKA